MSNSPSVCRADEDEAGFVELYRAHECLWNTECPSYRSRAARYAAYRSIARRIGAVSTREVAQRIRLLRNAYRQELKRIEEGSRGERANTWFRSLEEFLGPILRSKQTDPKPERFERTGSFKDQLELFSSKDRLELSTSRNCQTVPLEHPGGIRSGQPATNPPSKNGRSLFPADEYARFGDYVAAALARMPFEYAVSAETEIHRVIVKYRVYAMRKSTSCHRQDPVLLSQVNGDNIDGSSSGLTLGKTKPPTGAQEAASQGYSSDGNASDVSDPGPSRPANS